MGRIHPGRQRIDDRPVDGNPSLMDEILAVPSRVNSRFGKDFLNPIATIPVGVLVRLLGHCHHVRLAIAETRFEYAISPGGDVDEYLLQNAVRWQATPAKPYSILKKAANIRARRSF